MIIRSRAPVRISFGGGGTDLSPYCDNYGGLALNTTINKYVYVTLIPNETNKMKLVSIDYRKTSEFNSINDIKFGDDFDLVKAVIKLMKPDYGFDLIIRSDIPPNTGLGSSGSVSVALIGAFNHLRTEDKLKVYQIAELAYKVESEILCNVSGRQDQYAAAYGGFNYIEFNKDDFVRVNKIEVDRSVKYELEKHLVLGFLGSRGKSGDIQKMLVDQKSSVREENTKILHDIKELCNKMYTSILNKDLDLFGDLLDRSWNNKRKLSDLISNDRIDTIYKIVKDVGVIGGKISGAGGGGCMIFFCESDKEHFVESKLVSLGVKLIPFSFDYTGLKTWSVHRRCK